MIKKIDFTINAYDAKPLPNSEELERQVLCCIMDNPDECMPIAMKLLNAKGIFYGLFNDEIWQFIKKQNPISISVIKANYDGLRDKEKSANFLSILKEYPHFSGFQDSCLLLNEFWVKRTIHRFGHYLNAHSLGNENDPLELMGLASDSIDKIYQHIARMKEVTLKDSVSMLAKELHAISISVDGMLGKKGSINALNNVIKGYRKGLLISVGGGTHEGKTTFAIQEIRHFIEQGTPLGVFSLEMKTEEYILIMACDACNVPTENMLGGNASSDEINRIGSYMEKVKRMPLFISDTPAQKIGSIISQARLWKKNNGIELLFVDHGHLINGDVQYPNTEQQFTDIANKLKALAKELDIPVITLWQLARKDKGDKTPHKVTDIKYAGGVEQASDIVILIYRPEMHGIEAKGDGESMKGVAKFIIGKLRLLPRYDIKCHFTGTRFNDWKEFGGQTTLAMPVYQQVNVNKFIEPEKEEKDLPF